MNCKNCGRAGVESSTGFCTLCTCQPFMRVGPLNPGLRGNNPAPDATPSREPTGSYVIMHDYNQPVIPPGHQPFPLTPEEIATIQKTRAEAADKARTCTGYVIQTMNGDIRSYLPDNRKAFGEPVVCMRWEAGKSFMSTTITLPRARELIEKLGLLIGVAEGAMSDREHYAATDDSGTSIYAYRSYSPDRLDRVLIQIGGEPFFASPTTARALAATLVRLADEAEGKRDE
jgi:hypothetical protein